MSAARRRRPQQRRQQSPSHGAQTAPPQAAPPSPLGLFWVPLALDARSSPCLVRPRILENLVLTRSLWAAVVGLLVWQFALVVRLRGQPSAGPFIRFCARSTTCRQRCRWPSSSTGGTSGGRSTTCLAAGGPVAVRLRLRHAAVVVAPRQLCPGLSGRSRSFSARTCSLVPRRLVLPAVPDAGAGLMGKELVRWQRDGRSTHIFNPSAFSLGPVSLVLIATSTTDLTWGLDIATTLTLAPHINLFLFLIGLVVMFLLLNHARRRLGGDRAVRVERAVSAVTEVPVLHRLRDSQRGVPGPAPAGDRPFHLAKNAARQDTVRGALRARGLRALLGAGSHRRADLLRQAAVGAAPEPECAMDRPAGPLHPGQWHPHPVEPGPGHRPGPIWST